MKYLAFGGGVNSTALYFLLRGEGIEFEAIFIDHGGDPEHTYQYVSDLKIQGFKITTLHATSEGKALPDYIWEKAMIPSRQMRWCTDRFKIRPLHNYIKKPCILYLGIDAGERHRVKPSSNHSITLEYPLIKYGFTRKDCETIIKQSDIEVPQKSGCWFCPFLDIQSWWDMYEKEKDKFNWCVAAERRHNERLQRKYGAKEYYFFRKPLPQMFDGKTRPKRKGKTDHPCICAVD